LRQVAAKLLPRWRSVAALRIVPSLNRYDIEGIDPGRNQAVPI
jgi:hypothetical protein